jgi:hypothetical protein
VKVNMDISVYYSLIVAVITSIVYALIAWKLSGEAFSETKFLRTVALSFAMALGFSVSGTPLSSIYVSPFASTLVGIIGSKYLNSIREVVAPIAKDLGTVDVSKPEQVVLQVAQAVEKLATSAPQDTAQAPASAS